MLLFQRVFFSTTKNYVNALKVRSRLADFFKHIHPDQMVQAPVLLIIFQDQNKGLEFTIAEKFQLLPRCN